MDKLETIAEGDKVYAILLRKTYDEPGPNFFTPDEFPQQFGMLVHKKGKLIKRHRHKLIKREIIETQEVLVLLEGKMRVDIYNDESKKIKSIEMTAGDSILLAKGGHKIEILENAKIIEVKQGPFAGFDDKEYY